MRAPTQISLTLGLISIAACTPTSTRLVVVVPEAHEAAIRDFVQRAQHPGLSVQSDEQQVVGRSVVLIEDLDCAECYRIERGTLRPEIHGGDLLGLQYGLASALEHVGFRFFHPHKIHFPVELGSLDDHPELGITIEPQVGKRRGLHLHTLHPTEALYDFWEPSAPGLERARSVVDWVVKNRGNHLQWVALSDAESGSNTAWAEHTRAIVDHAHARGLTVGFGVQLFGSGNLQKAFDLVDGDYDAAEVARRLDVLGRVSPDLLNLSFGEFSGEEPEIFVASANQAVGQMGAVVPSAEVSTVIHVGNYDNLRITYEGEEMLYYFLAQHVRGTVPWIHTVMYYNLFDDAGLAYLHEEFDEHRAFLLERLQRDEPVGYFPESAYWVAFDVNVPTYLPVYVRSRHTDLAMLRQRGLSLQDHVLFSSGWEWGYWQNDYTTLRFTHTLPEAPGEAFREMFAPWGELGSELASVLVATMELQHEALIDDRLAPWLAGREAIIDLGDTRGIVSQPDRPGFDEIAAMSDAELLEIRARADALDALAAETEALLERLEGYDAVDRWIQESLDGLQIDALRARFAARSLEAAAAVGAGQQGDAAEALASASGLLDEARSVVARRHGDLHWAGGRRILESSDSNASLYQFGYLAKAETLCFWEREEAQLEELVSGEDVEIPNCT